MRQEPTQIDRLERLATALAASAGLIQWIESFVLGRNEGGLIVALYGRAGSFPACKVYEERFGELPGFVEVLFADDDRPLPKDRETAVAQGRMVPCRRFQIVRFNYPGKDKWFFGGVLRYGRFEPREGQEERDPLDLSQLKSGDMVRVRGNRRVISAKFKEFDGEEIVIVHGGEDIVVSPGRVSRIIYTT